MNAYISIISYSLAWALVYSLFQGLFIYTVLFMVLKAFPGVSARTKYIMSYSAISAMFVWFVYTWASRSIAMAGVASYLPVPNSGSPVYTLSSPYFVSGSTSGGGGWWQMLNYLEQFFPYVLGAYVIGLAFMATRFFVNIKEAGKLRREETAVQAEFECIAAYWRGQLGIRRQVLIFLTDRVNVPVMLGAVKPIILLPFATVNYLTTEQVESIILHELAHVKRHDYLFNILQTVVETILFFNPFVWATSAIIRREREHCCDDIVVACSGNPLPYAKALTILESQRIEAGNLTLAATGNKNQLLNRIKRIMEMKKSNTHYSKPAIIVSTLIATAFITVALTPTFAQKVKVDKNDTTKSRTTTKYKTITVNENGKKTEKTKVSDKPYDDKDDEANGNIDINVSFTDHDNGKVNHQAYRKKMAIDKDDMSALAADLAKASADIKVTMAGIKKELSDVEWAKIQKEISDAVAELDKTINDPALHKKIKVEVSKGLDEASKELHRASKELKKSAKGIAGVRDGDRDDIPVVPKIRANSDEFETMLDKMEGEGLINRNSIFRVEKMGHELYINGQRQSRSVYEKYEKYLPYQSAEIKGNKETLKINVTD